MPVDPSLIAEAASASIQTGLGAAQTVVGLINNKKAKREAARLAASRPKLKKSPFVGDQLSLAESELAQGMSAEAENAYNQGMDRDLSSSLDAILKGGGSVNNVAEVFDRSSQGRQRLALMQDNLRLNQIQNLAAARNNSENERQQMFQFNTWAPWADDAKANAAARSQAQNQIWGGLSTMGSSLMRGAAATKGKNDLDKAFQTTPAQYETGQSFSPSTMSTTPMTGYRSPAANINYINPDYASSLFGNQGYDGGNLYESEQY